MASGMRSVDKLKYVPAFKAGVPSSASPKWVSLKGYQNVTIILKGVNTTGVTGSAVTLNQAQKVDGANGNSKALVLDTAFSSTDVANSVTLTQMTVSSNTFTTTNTANAWFIYAIEVKADRLDMANGFDCLQVALGNAVNSTIDVTYVMGWPRYAGSYDEMTNPLSD